MLILGNYYNFPNEDLSFSKKLYKIYYTNQISHINIDDFVTKNHIDTIILNIPNNEKNENEVIKKIKNKNSNINYIYIKDYIEKYYKKYYIDFDSELSDLNNISTIRPYNKLNYFIKRIIDLSISIPLLLITLPIFIYSAYRIKKESPDSGVFFKQLRIGKDNKEFICYKFRSMRTDINYHSDYTKNKDPRIFPWGKIMRKTRIDELPQLWNVIKGDMHLIGPRAEWNKLVKKYEEQIPYYNLRHIIKPGITGWAQVNYKYGENLEDTKQKLMYDLYYIKNWSLWLEIKTIFKTIMVVIGKKGM